MGLRFATANYGKEPVVRPGLVIQDRYTLRELLGRGGMAEVWLAHDGRLDRPVAVKFLAQRSGQDPDALVRFFSEAQSVARIQHPGIVTVLDFGTFEDHPFLVMYYMSGGSLADVVGTPITPEQALPIIERVADAAGAAHKLGIVHRDIKPGNILIDEDGNPRLADFGIALSAGAEHLTETGTAVGSPHYVSPEQALGAPTTPRSDVYALGVVLYELLSGRKPFSGNLAAIVTAHVEQTPRAPSTFATGLTRDVDAVVMKCLAKAPKERFASGAELADAIRSLGVDGRELAAPAPLKTLAAGASADGTDEMHTASLDFPAVEPGPRPDARRRRLAAAMAAVVVLAIALAITLIGGGGRSDPARGTEDDPRPRLDRETNTDPAEQPSPAAPTESSEDPGDESGGDESPGGNSDGTNGSQGEGGDAGSTPSPSIPPSPDPSSSPSASP
jgi:eukaryotic-like serine/threonine-protein kinase